MFESTLWNYHLAKTIYWTSFLIFPFILLLFLLCKKSKRKWQKIILSIFLLASAVFVWARFIETQIILTKQTHIQMNFEKKIVLISDIHLGVYKKTDFLKQVVTKINEIDPDMVLIAGDFIYFPEDESKEGLKQLFEPLTNINAPIFAVLGNHDAKENKFHLVNEELKEALAELNVVLIENEAIDFGDFTLLGLGSHWRDEDNTELLDNYKTDDTVIVLAHNPDTTLKYTNNNADLTLAGHTHAGQIRIPFLYKIAIPTEGDFDVGLSQEKNTLLYTSSGLGETGLPLRLFNPPTINVLVFEK